ncbi:MAG TPA: metallophosphoesterase [Longimicrobiaceae bacterium]|jgi:predicted phosphodiesterase|nr:metallophosphoesterase [Longimicrobiaceae bacterium]
MRIFALSDLHTDFRDNRALLDRLPAHAYRDDALIVAGDVADRLETIGETLGFLRSRFAEVFFVPGNHELWVRNDARDSVQKFAAVLELCDSLGVRTRPARAAGRWVVPLFSWYTADFDRHGSAAQAELDAWSDFYFCHWPASVPRPDEYFAALNARHVRRYDAPVVSFSHFVPRLDLLPPVRYLGFKGLPRVAGSERIEEQIRLIGSAVHVFGHTHIMEDRVTDGVRYVQNWLRPLHSGAVPDAPLKLIHEEEEVPGRVQPLFC